MIDNAHRSVIYNAYHIFQPLEISKYIDYVLSMYD